MKVVGFKTENNAPIMTIQNAVVFATIDYLYDGALVVAVVFAIKNGISFAENLRAKTQLNYLYLIPYSVLSPT